MFGVADDADFACAGWLVLTVMEEAGALLPGAVEVVFVVTTIVDEAGAVRVVAGCAFCTVTEFCAVEAACATGTLPAPGVPIPGNTVPCCKLPTFGCVAGGVVIGAVALVCVEAAGCFSGKLIGGNFGGTGIGAGAALDVSGIVTGSGLR